MVVMHEVIHEETSRYEADAYEDMSTGGARQIDGSPGGSEPSDGRLDTLARVGTAMADGVRQRILLRLLDGASYPAELAEELGESRANISNHLTCLRGCGLVRAAREGRQIRYDLADAHLAEALRTLSELRLTVEAGHRAHEVGTGTRRTRTSTRTRASTSTSTATGAGS